MDLRRFFIFGLFSISLLAWPACQQDSASAPNAAQVPDTDKARVKRPRHAALKIPDGQEVVLSGSVAWDGRVDGVLRIDVITLADGKPPELVHQSALEGLGPFQVGLPSGFGEVHLVAYMDRNDNGPSEGEPVATGSFQVMDLGIDDIALVLSVDTDLGRLAPGAPPPADAGPPPEDNSGMVEPSSQAAAGR